MIEICVWPCGTWCEREDLGSYLQWMSDDFETLHLTEDEYDEFLRCN